MSMRTRDNIILIGFSYSGKSMVGRKVAKRLGWSFVDTDEEITKLAGKDIPQIFALDGEEHFRELERGVLNKACRGQNAVIATGGGAVLDEANRELMRESGVIICLEVGAETIYQRLLKNGEGSSGPLRPLLAAQDPLRRIRELKAFRQPYYDLADWKVGTDDLTVEEVSNEVIRHWNFRDASCVVRVAGGSYPLFINRGLLEELGERMKGMGLLGKVSIISDQAVFSLYGARARESLERADFGVNFLALPPGETSKTIENAIKIYDFLIERRVERNDIIVALGGGVVGDLAGFVAATFLRGLPLVQVPTSLIAMVDASIGGKTAVNRPGAKNLIGVFYQPKVVLADVETLLTLPHRELISGWSEVIKHAMILSPELLRFLEERAEELLELNLEVAAEAIRLSASLKAEVVSEDEKERGRRIILNYGHTLAHGLEAATGYAHFLHGEAVAVGMMGAAIISHELGLLSSEVVERQRTLLERFGLPTRCSGVNIDSVLGAMELDKKVRSGKIRWVLLGEVGQPVIRDDVPRDVVLGVIRDLLKGNA
jgi:3-dehydroquinate synthase